MDAHQPWRLLKGHVFGHGIAPVAALRDVTQITQALHERRPRFRNARRIPSDLPWLLREAVARQRWDDEVEGVGLGPAMRGGISQRPDDLHLLDDRTWPAMSDD